VNTLRAFAILVASGFAFAAQAETRLLMAEEHGCYWCERWDDEIAQIYPKTREGRTAPLERYDLHGEAPQDVTFTSGVVFTPTFILVEDGQEVGRIEGYPGEDFFWGLLTILFENADIPLAPTG
jgi:thioredoxin-related protein